MNYFISNDEFDELNDKFGDLIYFIAHQIIHRNSNIFLEFDDIVQELRSILVYSVITLKKQDYIEKSLFALQNHIKEGDAMKDTVNRLDELWRSRKKKGSGFRKFDKYQEKKLDRMIQLIPKMKDPLKINH